MIRTVPACAVLCCAALRCVTLWQIIVIYSINYTNLASVGAKVAIQASDV